MAQTRREREYRAAKLCDALLQFRIGETCIDFPAELDEDLGGRVLGSSNASDRTCLEAGHEISYGRDVREPLPPRCGRYCKCSRPTGLQFNRPRSPGPAI